MRAQEFMRLAEQNTLGQMLTDYPIAADFLANMRLMMLDRELPLMAALEAAQPESLEEFGLDAWQMTWQFCEFMALFTEELTAPPGVDSITIIGGRSKSGEPEDVHLTIAAGEVVSVVGPTGSGKSRLLGDIEALAQRDTPTGRLILVNGAELEDDQRFEMEGKLVAQLSQNMNFVIDLTVAEFLQMHAKSRLSPDIGAIAEKCFVCANQLAGEKFTPDTKVTQLSGGQSRALMIADTAFMSSSPIVLIDEIENAGIDRRQAIRLLAKEEKIVLVSTHDPLLALSAHKRIVIRNGRIDKVIETSAEERDNLLEIEKLDNMLQRLRHGLRYGAVISREYMYMKED